MEEGYDYYGGDVGRACGLITESWKGCSEECQKNEQCKYWSWLTEDFHGRYKQCCLKSEKTGKTQDARIISGAKGRRGVPSKEISYLLN